MTDAVDSAALGAGAPPSAPLAEGATLFSKGYIRYSMWLLMGIYVVNFLDRQIVTILAEPIKRDLGLADWQLGLMSGLAFAVFYTVLGIPIARLAERRNRAMIIGASITVWSGFTALCATATNFWQLIIYRVGVGIGEAGCTPAAHSMIVDYAPREKRASMLAFYSLGAPIGALLGLAMGGLIADAFGWRAAFLIAGAPGLIFAVLAFFTLEEPREKLVAHARNVVASSATFGETLAYLLKVRTFWLIALGGAVKAFISSGLAPFLASFFLRVHGAELEALAAGFGLKPIGFLGITIGFVGGGAAAIGIWFGGWIADKYGSKDLRAYMVAPAIAALLQIPIYTAAATVGSAWIAFCIIPFASIMAAVWTGPVFSTCQSVVPPHMRATAAAILLFIINLVGLGLGPLAVGAMSDIYNKGLGLGPAEGLRWAMISAQLVGVVAFIAFWMARKSIREDTVS